MKCFYHNADLDGKCSAAIVHYIHPAVELIGINYGDPFPWDSLVPGEIVYMVDFSLQPFELMIELAEKVDLIWIDHHKTAIEAFEAHQSKSEISLDGIQRNGIGACALVWEWFSERLSDLKPPLPRAVKLLAEYDVWNHTDEACLPFQYGMREVDNAPKSEIWKYLFAPGKCGSCEHSPILKQGRTILSYEQRQNATRVKALAFEIIFDGLRCIAANHGLGNSAVFDSVWDPDKYDAMLLFAWHKDKWKVSLYTNKSDIDVSTVAKAYGGGGHKGAAGFLCEVLPFTLGDND